MAESDLSNFPDLVLLTLFKMLPVGDRGRLACCSRRLSTFMDCPSVWRSVVLDLDMDIVPVGVLRSRQLVGSLCARDRLMIEKYGQHFETVKIVISNPYIENHTWGLLTQLSHRNVIKCVSLRFDQTFLKAVRYLREQSLSVWYRCEGHLPSDALMPRKGSRPVGMPKNIGDLVEHLGSETEIRLKLPTQNVAVRHTRQLCIIGEFTTQNLYLNPKSDKFCAQLTKLILSSEQNSEDELARKHRRLSSPPTAHLISSFPSLQELHVNITNLSDRLLLELSRKPMRRMVMRHMFRDSQLPKLSSSSWEKLASACPGLRVECCVVGSSVITLHQVVKPQTPLVRLRVTCVSTEASLLALYELCHGQGDRLEQLEVRVEGEVWGREAVQEGWRGFVQACPSLRACWGLMADMESF